MVRSEIMLWHITTPHLDLIQRIGLFDESSRASHDTQHYHRGLAVGIRETTFPHLCRPKCSRINIAWWMRCSSSHTREREECNEFLSEALAYMRMQGTAATSQANAAFGLCVTFPDVLRWIITHRQCHGAALKKIFDFADGKLGL